MIINYESFFLMLSKVARSFGTSVKGGLLSQRSVGLAVNATYRLFYLVEVGNEITSYHVEKLVKDREKPRLAGEKSELFFLPAYP